MPDSERRYAIPCWREDSVSAAKVTPGGVGKGGGGRPTTAFAYTLTGIAARAGHRQATVWRQLGANARSPFRALHYIVKARRHALVLVGGCTTAQVEGALAVLAALGKIDDQQQADARPELPESEAECVVEPEGLDFEMGESEAP